MRAAQQRLQGQQGEPAAVAEPSRKPVVVPPKPKEPEKAVQKPAQPPKEKPPKPAKAKPPETVQKAPKPPPEHPPRLPMGATFNVTYDATAVLWSGCLRVPVGEQTLDFLDSASGVFRLLSKLDRLWRSSDAGRAFGAAAVAEKKGIADALALAGERRLADSGDPSGAGSFEAGDCVRPVA
jgi:hypothetical protein